MLKLNPPTGYPRLIENEHFFMRMAADCGLRVAKTQLLQDAHGRNALLVTRFDRHGDTRIAQEDACQLADLYPASKYRIQMETAIATLADACGHGGGSRAAAVLELLRTVVFSWLIGNGDLHGKNLSIYKPDVWRPTPAYDLLTTQPYTGWRDPMALSLYLRANRLNRAYFLEAAARLGLRERAIARMIDDIVEGARDWPDRCAEIGFSERETDLLSKMLRSRIETLQERAPQSVEHRGAADPLPRRQFGLRLVERTGQRVDGVIAEGQPQRRVIGTQSQQDRRGGLGGISGLLKIRTMNR